MKIEDLKTKTTKEISKDDYKKRWDEIDEQLHTLRNIEIEKKLELRDAMENLNIVQKTIMYLDDELETVCLTLQELNKK